MRRLPAYRHAGGRFFDDKQPLVADLNLWERDAPGSAPLPTAFPNHRRLSHIHHPRGSGSSCELVVVAWFMLIVV